VTATVAPDLVQDCLAEGEEVAKILSICDDQGIDYLEGFISAIGLDNEDLRLEPLRLLYNILGSDGEMSDRESIALLDNAMRGVFTCIAERDQ
jgi:hypothetical protein